MANKVINLDNTTENISSKDYVYQDISMIAKFRKYKPKANIPSKNFMALLKTEFSEIDEILYDDIYNCFLVQFSDDPNPTIEKINEVLKKLSGYKLDKLVDIKSVQNSIDNIFSWTPGERILNPEFGNRLYQYLYEGINQYNEEQIVAEIRNCVSRWEPRVTITNITNVSEVSDTEDNTIILNIEYYINGLNGIIYNKQYQYNRNQ